MERDESSVKADLKEVTVIIPAKADMETIKRVCKSKPEYKQKVSNYVERLLEIKRESLPPQKERNEVVEYIVESYFEYMEEYPTNTVLSMLSDFILLDYIKSVNKKRSDKNQFLTEKQKKRRERREYLLSTNETLFDFLYSKYELNNDSLKKQERVIHQ